MRFPFLQGLAFYGLYWAAEHDVWPANDRLWLFPLWTLIVVGPVALLLSITEENRQRLYWRTGVLTGVALLMAAYTGWMTTPDAVQVSNIAVAFSLSLGVFLFKGLMYLQQQANRQKLAYSVLFTHSWRNFLTAALAHALMGGVMLVLFLWGALFSAIGVDVFSDLFSESWFIAPALTVSFGLGVVIFRNLSRIIDTITSLLEGLIRLLLPLVVLIALLFTFTLPFVGLAPLWDTGTGTALLLWLTASMLFFVNAVYQTRTAGYPRWLQTAVCAGICTLPIFSVLSFYGLWLRLDSYGWTVERAWAMVIWLCLTLFALGYTYGIIRYRLGWTSLLAKTNTYMGWFILALMVLINSPVLDFRQISLNSQVERVNRAEITWHEFDFYYLKYNLGRPGYELAEQLKRQHADDTELLEKIDQPVYLGRGNQLTQGNIWANPTFSGEPFEIPEEVKLLAAPNRDEQHEGIKSSCLAR